MSDSRNGALASAIAAGRQGLNARRHVSVAMTIWLTMVWIAVFSSFAPLIVLSGLLIAIVIQLVFPLPSHKHLWHLRPLYAAVMLLRFVWNLIVAGVQVSLLVLSGRDHKDGIVSCKVRSGNPVYMTILAGMTSMVPGTIVIKVDPADRTLFLHVLDMEAHGGVEGTRKEVLDQERQILQALAPSRVLVETGLRRPGPDKKSDSEGG